MLLRAHNTDLLSIQDLLQWASLAEVFSSLQRPASRGRGADPLLQGSSSRGTHQTRTGLTPCRVARPSSMPCRRLRAPGLDIHGSPPSPSTQSSLNRIPAALKRKIEGEGESMLGMKRGSVTAELTLIKLVCERSSSRLVRFGFDRDATPERWNSNGRLLCKVRYHANPTNG